MKDEIANVTFVMSLPRSRSAWIVATFSPGACTLHDPLKQCASIDDLRVALSRRADAQGRPIVVADTAAIFFYAQIAKAFPHARFLFVHRDSQQVELSLSKQGMPSYAIPFAREALVEAHTVLAAEQRTTWWIDYSQLDDIETLREMWQFFHCQGDPPAVWFQKMLGVNVQIPFPEQRKNTDPAKVAKLFASRLAGEQRLDCTG